MSTPSKDDIIRIKMAKAIRTLAEAEKMIEFNFATAALNRIYYACFYASTALLYSKDIYTKTHSGVKQMIGLHFIIPGHLSITLGKFYGDIFMSRQNADYDDLSDADIEVVKEYLLVAKDFLSASQNILNIN